MQKKTTRKTRDHLEYGQGQREQYGEGKRYRPDDKSKAADKFNDHDFAGGERKDAPLPDPHKPADDCR